MLKLLMFIRVRFSGWRLTWGWGRDISTEVEVSGGVVEVISGVVEVTGGVVEGTSGRGEVKGGDNLSIKKTI